MSGKEIWESMGLTGRHFVQNYDTRMLMQYGLCRRPGFGEIWCNRDDWWHQNQDSKSQEHEFGQVEYIEGTQQIWDTASLEWIFRDGHAPYENLAYQVYQGHLPVEIVTQKRYPGLLDTTFRGRFLHARDRILLKGNQGTELLEITNDVNVLRFMTLYLFGMTNSGGEIRRDGERAVRIVEKDNHGEIAYTVAVSTKPSRIGFTSDFSQWDKIRRKATSQFPEAGDVFSSDKGRIYYVFEFPVVLEPEATISLTTAVRYIDILDHDRRALDIAEVKPEVLFEENRNDWQNFYAKELPRLDCDIQAYAREINYIFTVLRCNANRPRGLFRGQYIVCFKYIQCVCPTDSAGGAACAVWFRNSLAEEAMSSIYDTQFKNGFISQFAVANGVHLVGGKFQHIHNPAETVPDSAKRSNAPIAGMMAHEIYRIRGNREFALRIAEPIQKWVDWWFGPERDPDGDGLCDFIGTMESSLDHTLRTKTGRITAIDLNVYLQGTLRGLADLWRVQEREDQAVQCERRAAELKEKINRLCWNEPDGFYYDLADGKQTGVKTSAAFQTLATDIPDRAKVKRLVEHILDPNEFWTPMPISGIAKCDLPDNPNGYPHWDFYNMFNMTWFALLGLWRWGYQDVAAKITWRMLRLTQWTDEPMAPAAYNGRTAIHESGTAEATFSTSLADFFMRFIAGIHPDSVDKKVEIAPWLGRIGRLEIGNLPYGDGDFIVSARKEGKGMVLAIDNHSSQPMRVICNPAWCQDVLNRKGGKSTGKEFALKPAESKEVFLVGSDTELLHDNWQTPWKENSG